MITLSANLPVEQREGERLGTLTRLLATERMHNRIPLFARVLLKAGSRIPLHQHLGTFEAFYILSGKGRVIDNGNEATVSAGDIVFTDDGESHAIENPGPDDLEYVALVVITTP